MSTVTVAIAFFLATLSARLPQQQECQLSPQFWTIWASKLVECCLLAKKATL
ncbi:hypothetical protein [Chlorogloeopsis sp. ULAP02]|uniref:hypothetical protein n=1 Tax=Chlorogloeopsis sp. ULAP02 TaxID=3107926 RepID=UPI003136979C